MTHAKAFESAGLTPPKTLLERVVVIGPASLLVDSSRENLSYMGITEYARQRDAERYSSGIDRAVTIRDHPGKIADTVDGRPRILLNASAFGPATRRTCFIRTPGRIQTTSDGRSTGIKP